MRPGGEVVQAEGQNESFQAHQPQVCSVVPQALWGLTTPKFQGFTFSGVSRSPGVSVPSQVSWSHDVCWSPQDSWSSKPFGPPGLLVLLGLLVLTCLLDKAEAY